MLISSIDLMNGKAVQLKQGKELVLEFDNPAKIGNEFGRFGKIAVIDLDAAFEKGSNTEIIREICKTNECSVGGGIRTVEKAKELFSFGASEIILGSGIFSNGQINLDFVKEVGKAIGPKRVIAAVDAVDGIIVAKGWKESTGITIEEAVKTLDPYVGGYLFTSVKFEGMMKGFDRDNVIKLKTLTQKRIVAAGGISTVEDVTFLDSIGVDSQVGMALYTGAMKPQECFIECLDWEKMPIIPVTTVDKYSQILMTAYMNKEAMKTTFENGYATYFSRSRNELWKKGETSGNTQKFISIRRDCDGDSLVMTVDQKGVACHTGSYSCYGEKKFSLEELLDVLKERILSNDQKSFTASLTANKLRQKIIEEAGEVVLAETKEEKIWEISDLIYFLTVLMAKEDISFDEIKNELLKRRRKR
jgi:phosphoribosyl-AMP cyclohydrolase / phosphoribosyl-ATP pyrophosphohydrolase